MKKILIYLTLIFFPVLLQAQPYSNREKMVISGKLDSLLQLFMIKSTLTEPGVGKQNIKVIREYKMLFTSDASIFDDINAEFSDDGIDFPYKLKYKPVEEYFDGIIEQFPDGLIINYKNININYDNLDQGFVKVALERNITGTRNSGKYVLVNNDSLLLKFVVQPDKSVKIGGISKIGSSIRVLNDSDLDGVIDADDACKLEKGNALLKGCPDKDEDGLADKDDDCPEQKGSASNRGCPVSTFAYQFVFSASVGALFNVNAIKPKVNSFGYNEVDDELSVSNVKGEGLKVSIPISANIAYYFGKKKFKKNKGISLGISFIKGLTTTYDVSGSQFFFRGKDKINDYRRIVTIGRRENATEKVTMDIFNIPLLFRYKAKLGAKWAGEIGAGPSAMIFTGSSVFNGYVDSEGIYQVNDNGEFVYTRHYVQSESTVLLTENDIKGDRFIDGFNNSAGALYNYLRALDGGYDFRLNELHRNQKSEINRFGFAFNAMADLFYHIRPRVAVKIGFNFIYAPSVSNSGGNYEPLNETGDQYNTVFNTRTKSAYTAFGLNAGIITGF